MDLEVPVNRDLAIETVCGPRLEYCQMETCIQMTKVR